MTENDPGILYTAGLEEIAEQRKITLEEAYRIGRWYPNHVLAG